LAICQGQQLGDPVDGVVGDAAEEIAQIGLGIEAVQLGGLDEGVDSRGPFAAGIGACEHVILAAEGERPDSALGGVAADLQAPAIVARN
jgi:hypothetical protein